MIGRIVPNHPLLKVLHNPSMVIAHYIETRQRAIPFFGEGYMFARSSANNKGSLTSVVANIKS